MSDKKYSENTDLNSKVMDAFAKANLLHRGAVESFAKKYGMQQSQHRLLMKMAEMNEGKPVSQRDVAREMNVTPAAIAVNLKKLAGFGMIEKEMSEKDNRFNNVCFTRKGKATISESEKKFAYYNDAALEGFTEEEKETLLSYMNRIIENMEKTGA